MRERQHFTIVIRSEPGDRTPLIVRLRSFLKIAKRRFGLRCVSMKPGKPGQAEIPAERSDG